LLGVVSTQWAKASKGVLKLSMYDYIRLLEI
jgi:hypothetical protein